MKLISYFLIMMFIFFTSSAHAFFCPTNFQGIEVGDNIDVVRQRCGTPDHETSKKEPPPVPQEWNYYISQSVSTQNLNSVQGTLKTSMAFDSTGKLINLSVNGIGVGETSICNGQNIQLGDTQERVKAACGEPSMINKQATDHPDNRITTLVYSKNSTPVTLIFTNGKLTEKR